MKNSLEENGIEMYSTENEGKPIMLDRFIKILKTQIRNYMTNVSKEVYNDKLDDLT